MGSPYTQTGWPGPVGEEEHNHKSVQFPRCTPPTYQKPKNEPHCSLHKNQWFHLRLGHASKPQTMPTGQLVLSDCQTHSASLILASSFFHPPKPATFSCQFPPQTRSGAFSVGGPKMDSFKAPSKHSPISTPPVSLASLPQLFPPPACLECAHAGAKPPPRTNSPAEKRPRPQAPSVLLAREDPALSAERRASLGTSTSRTGLLVKLGLEKPSNKSCFCMTDSSRVDRMGFNL